MIEQMLGDFSVSRVRRTYNQWVANETLEDFALRFTAFRARKWSSLRVANTAIGSISFLALEAIGGAMTLSYGFNNAVAAILIVGAVLFITGIPIAYHSARAGVDIDLLTRGAGFGYLGSTITSLVYASFTFIFFALEAAILAQALEYCLGVPLEIGYLLNALLVIPLVTHGFARIGSFQKWTQPLWIVLQVLPFAVLAWAGVEILPWVQHQGLLQGPGDGRLDPVMVAAATGIAFALIAQIGEQVDFLRFLPQPKGRRERAAWWLALLSAGPGWAVIGTLKMLAGSFLTVLILNADVPVEAAIEPTIMYLAAYERFLPPEAALVFTIGFVILAQLKINVTNAYAGSIAWSNFFARVTHSHPGRVVWLVFNVAIALMLMQFGVFGALENTLALYSHVALAWIGAITADLMINLPLGLRPSRIEFRRAYLFDLNPVGVGAATLATVFSLVASLGFFGSSVAAFSSWIAFGTAMIAAPAIAFATKGRFYLARTPPESRSGERTCIICEHKFDGQDMVDCPFHRGAVCSLCCTLESQCEDACKPAARLHGQVAALAGRVLPARIQETVPTRYGAFALIFGAMALIVGVLLLIVYQNFRIVSPDAADAVGRALALSFVILVILVGVTAWLYTLSEESRILANREREQQTQRLLAEIEAHRRTDAELQEAKEAAEAANRAKSRYLVGITHELRTPLNAILGYAQLLENDQTIPEHRRPSLRTIRHSSEHLADLIEGLLDISKIEAGRIDVYRMEVNLRELLDQICAIFAIEAQAKGLEFIADIDPNTPAFVFADERRLRQILINLLSNAVRYTDRGSVRLSVFFRIDIAHMTVSDTGRGIPRSEWDRIFTPFERVVDPNNVVPGTGLGLTITKLLVEMLGGELTFESEVGKGSSFRLRLFLSRSGRVAPAEQVRPRRGYLEPRRHILIVDDNHSHRQLLADALAPLGFQLSMAESGEVALTIARSKPPDLALIDVAMPGMTGPQLTKRLRGDCGLTAPLILVSAHAGDQLHGLGGNPNHDGFIAKPVNIPALLDQVGELLHLSWTYDVAPAATDAPLWAPDEVLAALDEKLAIAHLRGLQAVLAGMDDSEPRTLSFRRRATVLVEAVDLEGLAVLIEETRHAA